MISALGPLVVTMSKKINHLLVVASQKLYVNNPQNKSCYITPKKTNVGWLLCWHENNVVHLPSNFVLGD
jgi:hypothetical protein